MIISVTHKDILLGEPLEADCCAVAMAIKRITGKEVMVDKTGSKILFYFPHEYSEDCMGNKSFYNFDNEKIAQFIDDYDNNNDVEPFEFEIPDDVL